MPKLQNTSIRERVDQALSQAQHTRHVFTRLYAAEARAAAAQCDAAPQDAQPRALQQDLQGWCITLKDNFDVAGETTLSGGVVCAFEPPALQDAPVVQRLRQAGAVLLGKTNMSEFAFSGVGINPHHGTPRNPADPVQARIPGGSSSGAAVSVALGIAQVGLGTDTGGSIRIPAALCGLVGFKSTQARIPRTGVMELARTLDTVGSITRSVRACLAVDAVLSQQPLTSDALSPLASLDPQASLALRGLRFAVPQTWVLDDLDAVVAQTFTRVLQGLSRAGACIEEIGFEALAEIEALNQPAGFSPVEGYAAHKTRLARGGDCIDPRVLARMKLGEGVSAREHQALHERRATWIAKATRTLAGFDAMLCPTVPMVAPLLEPLVRDDAAFFKTNRLLLRNPSILNYMDGCSWSLPCHAAGDLPVGLMVSACAGQDAPLARVALALEAWLQTRAS